MQASLSSYPEAIASVMFSRPLGSALWWNEQARFSERLISRGNLTTHTFMSSWVRQSRHSSQWHASRKSCRDQRRVRRGLSPLQMRMLDFREFSHNKDPQTGIPVKGGPCLLSECSSIIAPLSPLSTKGGEGYSCMHRREPELTDEKQEL